MVSSADVKTLNNNSYSPKLLISEVYEVADDIEFAAVLTVDKDGVPAIGISSSKKAQLHGVYLAECLKQMLTRERVDMFLNGVKIGG